MVVVTIKVQADATIVANKSVAVYPLILGVVPEEDNKTKAVVSAVKLDGIVIVSAVT